VLERIVHASGIDDHQCKIPLHVYAGASDAIVPAASAQAAFPGAGTLAGDHFTILDPATPGNRTADVVKHHLLADLAAPPPSTVQPAGPVPPERPAGHGQPAPAGHSQPAVRVSGGQGVQVGDRNVQYNVFSPTADAGTVPRRPRPAPAVKEAFDLGLIIPLREEFDCARQVFRFGPQLREQGSYLYPFTVPGSDLRGVAVVLHDMGAAVSGVTAADLLSRFDLPVLALMGIAGALDGDLRLGDVVVAKVVDPYFHRAKARPDASGDGFEFDSGGTAWRAGRDLVRFADNFRYRAGDPDEFAGWQARGEDRRKAAGLPGDGMPGRARPDYLVAPVASGEIVSAAAGFSRWLRTHHRECAAIEMEAGGVAQAVYEHGGTDMVIVRGISDFADERKTELDAAGGPAAAGHGAWREYAALNAADLLATLLRSPGFPWPSQSRLNR
jgi:nucleoside phosphorylase